MDSGDSVMIEMESVTVPLWVLKAKVTPWAKSLYGVLHHLAGIRETYPGHTTIGKEWLYTSRTTVSRASSELETIGAVTVRRDTTEVAALRGRRITKNTYTLRVTNPQIAHLKPAHNSAPVHYSSAIDSAQVDASSKGLEELSITTNAGETRQPRSFKAVVVEISEENQTRLGDLLELAAALRHVREFEVGLSPKAWSDVNVARAVVQTISTGEFDVDQIPAALLAAVRMPDTIGPFRIKAAGTWWDAAAQQVRFERKNAAGKAKATAIADCAACDEYGWLTDNPDVKCDHRDRAIA